MHDTCAVPELTRHGSSVQAVFDLLGVSENDLTVALGFVLSRSPALLSLVIRRVWPAGAAEAAEHACLDLEVRGEVGRTDLEIALPGALVILEPNATGCCPACSSFSPTYRASSTAVVVHS